MHANKKGTKSHQLKIIIITSFTDKPNYGITYRLWKLYIQLGIKVAKVNRVLEYNQDTYMKPYSMLNSKMRTKATTE